MRNFDVARIREGGFDLLVVPLDASFDSEPEDVQNSLVNDIQLAAHLARLPGEVVIVWPTPNGLAVRAAEGRQFPVLERTPLPDIWSRLSDTLTVPY